MFMKRLYGAVRCRTGSTHVNEVYAEQKTQEIFSMTGERVRNVNFQSGWRGNKEDCVYRSYVTYVSDSIQ